MYIHLHRNTRIDVHIYMYSCIYIYIHASALRGFGSKLASRFLVSHIVAAFWHSLEPGRIAHTPQADTSKSKGQIQCHLEPSVMKTWPLSFSAWHPLRKISTSPRYSEMISKPGWNLRFEFECSFDRFADHAGENTVWASKLLRNAKT